MANSVWLVTTISAVCAFAFANAAKHFAPDGHSSAPMHSRPETEAACQTLRSTSGASSRSPVAPVDCAQARNRLASDSKYETSNISCASGSEAELFNFCRQM